MAAILAHHAPLPVVVERQLTTLFPLGGDPVAVLRVGEEAPRVCPDLGEGPAREPLALLVPHNDPAPFIKSHEQAREPLGQALGEGGFLRGVVAAGCVPHHGGPSSVSIASWGRGCGRVAPWSLGLAMRIVMMAEGSRGREKVAYVFTGGQAPEGGPSLAAHLPRHYVLIFSAMMSDVQGRSKVGRW